MHELNWSACRVNNVAAWVLLSLYTSAGVASPIVAASVALREHHEHVVPYSVVAGDTLYGISQRYGLSVDALLQLNQRAPSPLHGNELSVGQVIYVPSARSQVLPELGDEKVLDDAGHSEVESFLAGQASRIGQAYGQGELADAQVQPLKNNVDARNAENDTTAASSVSVLGLEAVYLKQQIQSVFESEANEQANAWLGELGTAEVTLSFDDEFRLKSYSADVLAPIVDTPERMLFVQAGGRHDDSSGRTIVNVGVGQRHFTESWMFGYNAFFDHDVTRNHNRLGLGGEVWADYLKLSANVYTPLSSWKDSPDFDEYLERAARGFDINAKYYFPQYPQLGVSAKVEQYLGSEVDLLGSKTLDRNPYAGTVGLEWQPVPLLKVGVDHRQAKGGQSDTQISMGFEWKLGASSKDMLNPANVVLSRQLQGMRHDLVERNNNIVLEYKEKERAVTVEHASITGVSGAVVSLNPTAHISKGSIVSWHWSSPDPLLQGSLSDADIRNPTLTLPALPLDALVDKEFALYLTVTDELGRSYQSSPISVVVQVNPDLFAERLVVISDGHAADSVDSPGAEVVVDNAGVEVQFVLARYLKSDTSSFVTVEAQEVVFDPLEHYNVELLPGSFQGGARNAERVWVNRLKITPKQPGQVVAPVMLNVSAKGAAVQAFSTINLNLISATASLAKPQVSNLRMAGRLEVGQSLKATYLFNANGGNEQDKSTYAWGVAGSTSVAAATGLTVTSSGVVPDYPLTEVDVGEVMEVSVYAKNGAPMQAKGGVPVMGNTVTVDALGNASDSNGGTGGGGSDVVGSVVVDPANVVVTVQYDSSATLERNGVIGGKYTGTQVFRPVAGVDEMTAFCQVEGESEAAPCDDRFNLQWYVNGAPIANETAQRFKPTVQQQGLAVAVEATVKS